MIVSLIRVRWLTCVMVRPAWLRAAARTSPMLTARLHCPITPRPAHGMTAGTNYHSAPIPPTRALTKRRHLATIWPGPAPSAGPPAARARHRETTAAMALSGAAANRARQPARLRPAGHFPGPRSLARASAVAALPDVMPADTGQPAGLAAPGLCAPPGPASAGTSDPGLCPQPPPLWQPARS